MSNCVKCTINQYLKLFLSAFTPTTLGLYPYVAGSAVGSQSL